MMAEDRELGRCPALPQHLKLRIIKSARPPWATVRPSSPSLHSHTSETDRGIHSLGENQNLLVQLWRTHPVPPHPPV